jgi:hypothetical protein
MQKQRMTAGRGKPKELKTFENDGKTYFILNEAPAQSWALDRWILNESGFGVPDTEHNETVVAFYDVATKALIVKRVAIATKVEVKGL